jgi:hypothetical protein
MSLRFIDSFDFYATGDMYEKWTTSGSVGLPIISSGNGRRGTACARSYGTTSCICLVKTLDAQATWIIGVAFRTSSLPGSSRTLLGLYDAGTLQVDVCLNTDGTLSVRRNGATVLTNGTSSFSLGANTYYYLEWKCTIADAIDASSCQVRVDGDVKITVATGQDTKHTANATANQVTVGGGNSNANPTALWDIDDVYICDGQGSTNNDFLGDCRVDTLLPNADGSNSQFTPSTGSDHYALVDESAPNDDTDYLSDGTSGHRDTWNVANLSALVSPSIKGVQLNLTAKKDDAGTRLLKPVVKSGATTSTGASQGVGTDYRQYQQVYETDPNTSAAWTESGVNSAEFGVEVA